MTNLHSASTSFDGASGSAASDEGAMRRPENAELNQLTMMLVNQSLDDFMTQSLVDVHAVIQRLPRQIALALLEELTRRMEHTPEVYATNMPDALHNLAMTAPRFDRRDLELRILLVGRQVFPADVDLLCDLLQMYYTSHRDAARAAEVWNALQTLPENVRSGYWRYWVFGALYHVMMLHDHDAARRLVLEGVKKAYGNSKADVIRNLGNVFIDLNSAPDYDTVIKALKNGIVEGHSLGYVLATELAVLLQRRAGRAATSEERKRLLEEALDELDMAEALFTGDTQHSVTEIYRSRVNILMGLHRYQEALEYIRAIYADSKDADTLAREDPSLKHQFIHACLRTESPNLWREILGAGDKSDGGKEK